MSKNKNDNFGNRMKEYEQVEAGRKSLRYLPVCVRLDGKCFSSLTRNLERPYSPDMHNLMVLVAKEIMEESGASIAYTQSDEISLIYYNPKINSQIYFDGKFQKLTSVLASIATYVFNQNRSSVKGLHENERAFFDCRAWVVPNIEEAFNNLIWRELDASKNSISMLARCYYSHKQLENLGRSEQMELLYVKGINWNDQPVAFKRGTYVLRLNEKIDSESFENSLREKLKGKPEKVIEKAISQLKENNKILRRCVPVTLPPLKNITNPFSLLETGMDHINELNETYKIYNASLTVSSKLKTLGASL